MRLNQPNLCQFAFGTDFQQMGDKNSTAGRLWGYYLPNWQFVLTVFFFFTGFACIALVLQPHDYAKKYQD